MNVKLWLLLLVTLFPLAAGDRRTRYALVLEDAPVAERLASPKALATRAAVDARARIRAAQRSLAGELAARNIPVVNSLDTLANAVIVQATEDQLNELRALPGVRRIEPSLPLKRHLDRAAELVNAPKAWNFAGGQENAGAGVKIAIIDTGIDQAHAAFQDSALQPPTGYPKCRQADCAFTNNKVIVARSYVDLVAAGGPEDSRPDDLSARDRVGHGTAAAMVAAGRRVEGPSATITGIAPKAFLGNYKVFGSPGVNDGTFTDVVQKALEDAVNDGMNIAVLSLGRPAIWGPNDRGSVCQLPGNDACDLRAETVENAVRMGLTVVVSAGNDGDLGLQAPALGSIHTPGTAPSAITVGATTNSHIFFSSVRLSGDDAPAGLREIDGLFGNGPKPPDPLTAPLRDVLKLDDNGKACSPLSNNSLAGAVALIQRGDCGFSTKVNYAQRAGAVGVVLFNESSDFPFPPTGLSETGIPAVLIGAKSGAGLRAFLASSPDRPVTLDPRLRSTDADYDTVAYFSSQGPSIGENAIKPEVVAVGTDLYMAAQSFDPNGDMFDPSGFTAAQGTSFSAPMVGGAAALVKQRYPNFGTAELKSAVVNTAENIIDDYDADGRPFPARVTAVGAGILNAEGAVRTTVTANPATLSFGVIRNTLPSQGLRLTNHGNANVTLRVAVETRDPDSNARLSLSANSVNLSPGQTQTVTVRLEGSRPRPGSYEGAVIIQGGGAALRVPYLYLVGDGVPYNIIPLRGFDFEGIAGERMPSPSLALKVVDRFGVPVADVPVRFRPSGLVDSATGRTDDLGIADATVYLDSRLGEQEFSVEAGSGTGALTAIFPGRARLRPIIETNGVVNAASQRVGQGVAPGSFVSIFGQGLSDGARGATTQWLPLSLVGVSVSFDVPERKISLPGRLLSVRPDRVDVQVPWELQGLNSVLMKVSIGDFSSAVYSVPLNDYSPALFEYSEASSGRQLAVAQNESGQVIGTSNPAVRNQIVRFTANGLGPVENQPPTGEPTPAQPSARTRVTPILTIGGLRAEVIESRLAPDSVGLYEIRARVPGDVSPGIREVSVEVNGITSKTAGLPVQ